MDEKIKSYNDFKDLFAHEQEGEDFRIVSIKRKKPILIMAPHGGSIEPGTSEIARALANDEYSFYSFEGIKPSGNWMLHISSNNYKENVASEMLAHAETVITIHGCREEDELVFLGGLDSRLVKSLAATLTKSGFITNPSKGRNFPADATTNVCNQGKSGKGVQFEISRGLRTSLLGDSDKLELFVKSVRRCL